MEGDLAVRLDISPKSAELALGYWRAKGFLESGAYGWRRRGGGSETPAPSEAQAEPISAAPAQQFDLGKAVKATPEETPLRHSDAVYPEELSSLLDMIAACPSDGMSLIQIEARGGRKAAVDLALASRKIDEICRGDETFYAISDEARAAE